MNCACRDILHASCQSSLRHALHRSGADGAVLVVLAECEGYLKKHRERVRDQNTVMCTKNVPKTLLETLVQPNLPSQDLKLLLQYLLA